MSQPTVRHLAMFFALIVFAVADNARLKADANTFCATWNAGRNCQCDTTHRFNWTASCDFSNDGDPLTEADDFCNQANDDCVNTCNSADYINSQVDDCHQQFGDDPCCDYQWWSPWAQPNDCGCGGGEICPTPSMACGCNAVNWCIG